MSLAAQFRALNQRAAVFRQDLFGTKEDGTPITFNYNNGEVEGVTAYYSPIRNRQESEQAGFLEEHDCIMKVVKANNPFFTTPVIGAVLLIEDGGEEKTLRIDEIGGTHPVSAEWVLGCKAQN